MSAFPTRLLRAPRVASRGLAAALTVAALASAASDAAAQQRPRPGSLPAGASRPPQPPRRPPSPAAPGAAAARPAVDSTRPVPLFGVVLDSLTATPLADALVQIASDADRTVAFTTRTDSTGRWRLEPGVRPGRYLAGFTHRSIDLLGIDPPIVLVEVRPDTAARLDLGGPSAATLRGQVCPNAPADRGVLVGSVGDALTGEAIAGAKVVLTWKELRIGPDGVRNAQRRLPVNVRPDGGYLICDLPTETELVANAEAARRRGGLIELRLEQRGLERRDFFLGDSTAVETVVLPDTMAAREGRLAQPIAVARGKATLSGTVRARDGRPLQGAKVQLWGSDAAGTTSAAGVFQLSGLPAGTYALDVRALGYAPKRVTVNLSPARGNSVAVTMEERLNTLQSVVVQADRTKLEQDYTGFTERSKRGMGRYLNEEDIEKRGALQASDLFRTMPGLRVVPNGTGFGYALQGRGNCTPDVFIDGMRVFGGATDLDQLVRPFDIGGVEVYNGAGTVPAQFMSAAQNGCGVVAIWTKRGKRPT